MRKHFIKLILVILISITFGISNVKASCGDLVYDVLDMSITETKITIRGWAFIHKTCNGYYRKDNEADKNSTTNQQIKINLCNDSKCYYNDAEGNDQTRNWFDFDYIMGYTRGGIREKDYTYQNIGFEVSFEIDTIREIFKEYGENQELYFTIAATNDDYSQKYDEGKCNGTESFNQLTKTKRKKINGRNWVEEKMKVLDASIRGNVNNETIEIKAAGTEQLLYTGWHTGTGKSTYIGWGQIYAYQKAEGKNNTPIDENYVINTKATNPGTYTIKARRTTNSYSSGPESSNYYTCANYEIDDNGNTKYNDSFLNVVEYEEGYSFCNSGSCRNVISTFNNNGLVTTCSNDWINVEKYISFAKVFGKTTLNIKIKNDKKCEVSEPSSSTNMNCNDWTNLSSSCDELTIRENDSSAVVEITQNGYISNIFKSNLVNNDTEYNANSYDGGWFQYAIVYRNEVSFNIKSSSLSGSETDINNAMQSRIKNLSSFQDNIELDITNGLENITGTKLIKKCTESGNFTNDNTLVTTCTFFLPSSEVMGLGKVTYSENEADANVTNKYYIDFNENEHKVSVTLKNLSRLSDNKDDSKDKSKVWFGTWEVKTDCNLKVTNRLIKTDDGSSGDGKTKYKFIYRPIDLKNPFPNSRFPGVNWDSWYNVSKNKERLENSYTKRDYYTLLDNKTISEIKEYNKKNNYFGSVDEKFFEKYIKEGGSQ